jgi:translation initiation factor 2 subunit 2
MEEVSPPTYFSDSGFSVPAGVAVPVLTEEAAIEEMFKSKKKKKKSRAEEATPTTQAVQLPGGEEGELEEEETYDELLHRLYLQMGNTSRRDEERMKIKAPRVDRLGSKKTVWTNFRATCESLKRTEEHFQQFMGAELGTNLSVDSNGNMIIKGRFIPKAIESLVRKYIEEYVQCKYCYSMNTTLQRDPTIRLTMMSCGNCRASRSVETIKKGFHAKMKGERKQERAAAADAGL